MGQCCTTNKKNLKNKKEQKERRPTIKITPEENQEPAKEDLHQSVKISQKVEVSIVSESQANSIPEEHTHYEKQSEKRIEEKQEQKMGNQCCSQSPNEVVQTQQNITAIKQNRPVTPETIEEILDNILLNPKEEERHFEYQDENYIVISKLERTPNAQYSEYIIKKISDGENYSLKVLSSRNNYEEVVEEIEQIKERQQSLKNDAIVKYVGYGYAGNQLCVISERKNHGSLRQFLQQPYSYTTASLLFKYIIELYEALKEFYKEAIYPNYLSLDNIVIQDGRIKIDTLGVLDFGKKLQYNDTQMQIQEIQRENRKKEKISIKESGKIVIQILLRTESEWFQETLFTQYPEMLQNFYRNITSDEYERRSTAIEAIVQIKLMQQNTLLVSQINQNYAGIYKQNQQLQYSS